MSKTHWSARLPKLASYILSEGVCLKKQGGEQEKKKLKVDLWSPHRLTCVHAPIPTSVHAYTSIHAHERAHTQVETSRMMR